MVENYAGMNLNIYVRSVVYKGIIIIHIHLRRMEFQKG
jgi:hypothetical protein